MRKRVAQLQMAKSAKAQWLKVYSPVIGLIILALALAPWLVGPACPKHVVIATGNPEGAYYAFAERYREILERDGITLEVRSTAGSIENAELLRAADSGVSLAIMQGGTAPDDLENQVESLASLYREPVWAFHRADQPIERLTDLEGKRIALGTEGSGTRAVALDLLKQNGVLAEGQIHSAAAALGGRRAAAALKSGEIDAAFFVISPKSPIIRELLEFPEVELISFRRAAAYQNSYPFLSNVVLAEGSLDLKANLPRTDTMLLAPTANLVARSDLHPALVPLLLKAAIEVHQAGGLFEETGEFPSASHVEFPLNKHASRYLKSGPKMLYRYLPFSVAAWVDQVKLVLLPLCTLLLPFFKVAPPIYRWRIRSKIYRWYHVLREIDQKRWKEGESADLTDDIAKLRRLDDELAQVSVPLSYMEEFYNLRLHAAFVLNRVGKSDSKRSQPKNAQTRKRAA